MTHEPDATEIDALLIKQQLDSRPIRRFHVDAQVFGERASRAMVDAQYADGLLVLSLILESLLRNRVATGKNSGSARLARILAELFDYRKKGGRPKRQKGDVLRIIAERVLDRGNGSNLSIAEIASEAVEEILGYPDEALAEAAAKEFSADREQILTDYTESRYPHTERRIASLITDLLAACGLDVDPLVTSPIVTDPNLGKERTHEDMADDYDAFLEALARRD